MAEIQINGHDALVAALANAKGGETFVLAPGNYGYIGITGKSFTSEVTIVSADKNNMAHIDDLALYQVQNFVARAVDLGRPLAAGEPDYTPLTAITLSQNITFDGVHLSGSNDHVPQNDGYGLYVIESQNVTVKNSDIENVHRAFVFERSSNILISHNEIHNIRSDGGDYTAVTNLVVDSNYYHDFFPYGQDHPDIVQVWTNGQVSGSHNIQVTNNVFLQGSGRGIQGIFIRDELGGLMHSDILIENNLLYSDYHYEGISVSDANNVTIRNNTVLSPPDDNAYYWIKTQNVHGGVIENNVTDALVFDTNVTGIVQNHNLSLHDDPLGVGLIGSLTNKATTAIGDLLVAGNGAHPLANLGPIHTPLPPTVTPIDHGIGRQLGNKLAYFFGGKGSTGGKIADDAGSLPSHDDATGVGATDVHSAVTSPLIYLAGPLTGGILGASSSSNMLAGLISKAGLDHPAASSLPSVLPDAASSFHGTLPPEQVVENNWAPPMFTMDSAIGLSSHNIF